MKIVGMMLMVVGMAGAVMAQWSWGTVGVPEIDGGSVTTGLFLVSGALLVIKSRLKK